MRKKESEVFVNAKLLPEVERIIPPRDFLALREKLERWSPADLANLLDGLGTEDQDPSLDLNSYGSFSSILSCTVYLNEYLSSICRGKSVRALLASYVGRKSFRRCFRRLAQSSFEQINDSIVSMFHGDNQGGLARPADFSCVSTTF